MTVLLSGYILKSKFDRNREWLFSCHRIEFILVHSGKLKHCLTLFQPKHFVHFLELESVTYGWTGASALHSTRSLHYSSSHILPETSDLSGSAVCSPNIILIPVHMYHCSKAWLNVTQCKTIVFTKTINLSCIEGRWCSTSMMISMCSHAICRCSNVNLWLFADNSFYVDLFGAHDDGCSLNGLVVLSALWRIDSSFVSLQIQLLTGSIWVQHTVKIYMGTPIHILLGRMLLITNITSDCASDCISISNYSTIFCTDPKHKILVNYYVNITAKCNAKAGCIQKALLIILSGDIFRKTRRNWLVVFSTWSSRIQRY